MKKPLIGGAMLVMVLMMTSLLYAQIYKYIDENGQQRWTDDLSQVPVERRQSAEELEDLSDIAPATPATQAENESVDAPQDGSAGGQAELTRESLTKEKTELENQYRLLVEERKQIEKMKSEEGDATQQAELNQRISAYNSKTDSYETRLNAYREKVDAYNKTLSPNAP